MAISAVVTLTPSAVTNPLSFEAACVITNSGSSDVTVTGFDPYALANSAGAVALTLGKAPIHPGADVTVPGSSGTLTLKFGCRAHSPAGSSSGFPTSPSTQTYAVGAMVFTSDGSLTKATEDTIVVTAPSA